MEESILQTITCNCLVSMDAFNGLFSLSMQDNRDFVKVWNKSSKSTIMYENGKIYLENYQNCYSW